VSGRKRSFVPHRAGARATRSKPLTPLCVVLFLALFCSHRVIMDEGHCVYVFVRDPKFDVSAHAIPTYRGRSFIDETVFRLPSSGEPVNDTATSMSLHKHIRTLAMDAVRRATPASGCHGRRHGLCLWSATKAQPADPQWPNRDRFVLPRAAACCSCLPHSRLRPALEEIIAFASGQPAPAPRYVHTG